MDQSILWIIVLSAIVTAIIRAGPVLFLANVTFPVILRDWLAFIPIGILASIIVSESLHYKDLTSFGVSVSLLSVILTFVIGFVTRSLLACVITSIASFLIFQNL